ncbi:MAG TPA: molybdate ABC transporter substrate-binding protein, partial [Motilibacterales bacterium]|nr:molybdate ABC transporter substrate-binding protein [Motilibacterales bacterium]
ASAPSAASLTGDLTVMAAGPLKPAMDKAKAAFEAANPEVTITLDYGHVPSLLTQLGEGVPADVLSTPDAATMKMAQDKGFVATEPTPVAGNPLALVVPVGNPGEVTALEDLANADLAVAVCAAELPCGKLTEQLATKAGLTIAADSLEPGGSPGVVTKAAAGEIDLGVVFASDAKAGGDKVEVIPIDPAVVITGQVMAAPLAEAANASAATAFVEFLASPAGAALFTSSGFTSL